MRLRRAGFSLYEAMFSMALMGVGMLLMAGIFRESSRILATSREHDVITEATGQVFGQLRRDAQSAFVIEQPDGPTGSATLTLLRFRPSGDRFLSSGPGWTPYEPAQSEEVQYALSGTRLLRTSNRHDAEAMLDDVSTFQCSLPQADLLRASLTLTRSRGSQTLAMGIYLPVTRPSGLP